MAYLCGKCGCESCSELIDKIDEKLARMGNYYVDNLKFELDIYIDKELFKLLSFYKEVLQGVCCGCNCGCITKDLQLVYERVRVLLAKNSMNNNFKHDYHVYPNFNR